VRLRHMPAAHLLHPPHSLSFGRTLGPGPISTWASPRAYPRSVPIGLSELSWAFMWYFCTVLLGLFYPDKYLGWFGASHRTVMAMHSFVVLYSLTFYLPSLDVFGRPNSQLLELMDRSVRCCRLDRSLRRRRGLCARSLGHATPVQQSFRAGSGTLVILVWMLPIAMLSGHHRFILLAYNRQTRLLGCMIASAVAAVRERVSSSRRSTEAGAACALLIANALNLVLVYFSVRKLNRHRPLWPQLKVPLPPLKRRSHFLCPRPLEPVCRARRRIALVISPSSFGKMALACSPTCNPRPAALAMAAVLETSDSA